MFELNQIQVYNKQYPYDSKQIYRMQINVFHEEYDDNYFVL